jgi:hypothetical protein
MDRMRKKIFLLPLPIFKLVYKAMLSLVSAMIMLSIRMFFLFLDFLADLKKSLADEKADKKTSGLMEKQKNLVKLGILK